jgi:hypothetical protein
VSASWRIALDAQMGLWRWYQTDVGRRTIQGQFMTEAEGLNEATQNMQARLYAGEVEKVLGADPIFVSAEMCELVAAAADPGLPEPFRVEPLYVTDLPVPCGFMWYEKPFAVPDRFDRPVNIAAVAWSPVFSVEPDEADSVDVETAMRDWQAGEMGFQKLQNGGISLSIYDVASPEWAARGLTPPPIELMHLTPWWFGMGFEGNEYDENGVPTGAAWWWRIVEITFRLMQQRLASKESTRSERSQRRQMGRFKFPERETLVVRLRRKKKPRDSEGDGEPANYSHRFIVSGHWRNQWYPKSNEHRQIWISPFVKGDEDLPLVVKPRRALVWSR